MSTNPYIGPRAFERNETDYFFGRDEEIEILAGQVMVRRASLLFAQSGAGKSSLLRAGLLPNLTRRETVGRGRRKRTYQKMTVLPILTVGRGIPDQIKPEIENFYSFSALLSLLPQADPNQLAGMSLSAGLAHHFAAEEAALAALNAEAILLIIDQFEEIFTHHPDQGAQREAFFNQLNQALGDHTTIHLLLAIREDFIAQLTPYERLLPEPLQSRFRLEPLQPAAALVAIKSPAAQAQRTFAEGVAESLVDNLRRSQPGSNSVAANGHNLVAAQGMKAQLGPYVEPVHLQIVCRQLWDNLPPERTTIQSDDLSEFGNVDQALTDFYELILDQAIEQTKVSQRAIRAWLAGN